MVFQKTVKRYLALAFTAAVLLASVGMINAQDQANQSGGSGLSISPTRSELNIEKGQSQKLEINIKNVTKGAIVAKPYVSDFEADDVTGEPKFYEDADKRNSASISGFVSGLEDVTLEPGEKKDLVYDVSIPNDASSGAYYGAIVYRAVPVNATAPDAGQVSLTANLSSLVLIEVPGDIVSKIEVTDVKAEYVDSKGARSALVFTKQPNRSSVVIKNLGNSFAKPFGTVYVNNMFGKSVYSYEINNTTPRGNILPDSARTFSDEIKNISQPGRYKIQANVSHGNGGEIIVAEDTFWYLPVWFILILVGVILAVVLGGVFAYRRLFSKKNKSKK